MLRHSKLWQSTTRRMQKTDTIMIDARGLRCPLPVLKLRKTLSSAPNAASVRLLADDPMAWIDVEDFCQENQYTLLSRTTHPNNDLEFVVQKP
jgi:tRNA 2-thiouridine synthesizing protein A